MKVLDHFRRFMAEEASSEAAPRGDDMIPNPQPNGNRKNKKDRYDRVHFIGPRTFAEELAAMVANPPTGSVPMTITPEMAKEMLRYNEPREGYRNRPKSDLFVQRYATAIRSGRWGNTGVPIIFSDAHRLIDGQTRLQAVIASGVAVEMHVVFGVPHKEFANIDSGRKRTAADIFSIQNVPNATMISAAIKLVWKYDHAKTGSVGEGGGYGTDAPSSEELYEFYLENRSIHEGAVFYDRMKRSKVSPPTPILALWYICARKSRRDADRFFHVLTTGADADGRYDPALVARNRIYDLAALGAKPRAQQLSAIILGCWSLYRSGRSGRYFKYDPQARVPRAQ